MKRQYYYTLDAARDAAIGATGIHDIRTDVGCHVGLNAEGVTAFRIWPTYDEKFKKCFYISYTWDVPQLSQMIFEEGKGVTKLIY